MILAFSLLLACGDKDDTPTDGGTADGGAQDGGGTDGGAQDGGGSAGGGRLSGRVVDPSGRGVSVQMRLCAELCRSAMTDAQGYFVYEAVEADHYALQAVYLPDQKNYAMPMDILTIHEDEQIELAAPMILYPFATVHDLGGKSELVELDGGLTVMANPAAMTASESYSPYLASGEPDYVAAVRVEPEEIGLPLPEVQGTVRAAWFMGRASVSLSPAWGFTLEDDLGLPEGTELRVLAADVDRKVWVDGGPARVSGGRILSDDDAGIAVLSTVLLVTD